MLACALVAAFALLLLIGFGSSAVRFFRERQATKKYREQVSQQSGRGHW